MFFFFKDPATTEIYTLSLHDALPVPGSRAVIGTLPSGPLTIYRPVSAASLPVKLGDDSAHDHREFDSDSPLAIEYSIGGGSISLSPFTSAPGAARADMACPGMV